MNALNTLTQTFSAHVVAPAGNLNHFDVALTDSDEVLHFSVSLDGEIIGDNIESRKALACSSMN